MLKPGFVQLLHVVEPIEMKYCEPCMCWHISDDHKHIEPVEPDIKEIKIAGLLTY